MPRPRVSSESERLCGDDEGSASIEFITVGLLMLVPLVYLVVALGLVQQQSLGAESATRHIARALSLASDASLIDKRVDAIITTTVEEYGLDEESIELRIHCDPATASCPSPGAVVTVTLSAQVALPLVPPVLGLERIARVPVEASSVQKVSRLRSTP